MGFLNKLNCWVFQIRNLKCKKANSTINSKETAATKESQSPFNKAGKIKSNVAIGTP